jgi:GDP-L-fucose synthase
VGVGTGLVGSGIKYIIENEPANSRFGRRDGEEWIFLSSKDADLKFVSSRWSCANPQSHAPCAPCHNRNKAEVDSLFDKYKPDYVIHLAALGETVFHQGPGAKTAT